MSIMRLRLRFEDEPITSENKMKIKKDSKKAANLSTRVQDKGLDHVISTGRQMTNLVSNFEYLVLLSFLKLNYS